jgi:hypothetical protein
VPFFPFEIRIFDLFNEHVENTDSEWEKNGARYFIFSGQYIARSESISGHP